MGAGGWVAIAALAVLVAALAFVLLAPSPHTRPAAAAGLHEERPHSPLPTASANGLLSDPIDSRFLTELPFGKVSFWIQPWRAYLDTWPASRLRESLGINFDVKAPRAQAVARLLHESGFTLARIAINWTALSYSNPRRFVHEAELDARLSALRDNGLRPLILLDANSAGPAPAKQTTLQTTEAAPAGATHVRLSAASAAAVVPERTGFDASTFNGGKAAHRSAGRNGKHVKLTPEQRLKRREARRAAGLNSLVLQGNPAILIVKISGGVATLSHPLPAELPAGSYRGTTLLYAPFGAPKLGNGKTNPAFARTISGWLAYVATVCGKAASIFGAGGYDLEVWNELTFGSQFLNAERYEGTAAEGRGGTVSKQVAKALLDETVAYVRDPAHGISPAVGISDGFADQTPFASAASAPAGVTALSKHLYNSAKSFPAEFKARRSSIPLDALGARDTIGSHGSAGALTPRFVPRFQSLFPEYFLTAMQTATVARDLAPFETGIYGTPHGRYVRTHGNAPLQVWMTEYNLAPGKGRVLGADEQAPATGPSAALTPADKRHFQAKALLRSLVAMVGKGMTREYFYDAGPGPLSLINEEFEKDLTQHPNT
ncbi:MAG TPA: hypothetical protein VHU13_06950, partial [Solirubrobacteraceae bacterium]|nr:hypothetical protein [Solirubrobacteraceae bacterium]